MKKILFIFLVLLFMESWSAEIKDLKNDEDKSYQVETSKSQLQFDTAIKAKKTSRDFWYFAFSRSGIMYDIPTFLHGTTDFTNQWVGVTIGKKRANEFYNHEGFFEYSLEWQNYERHADNIGRLATSQSLNLLRLNLYQNFSILKDLKKNLFVSVGGGVSPLISALEQSSLSNSTSDLGFLVTVKTNFDYPVAQSLVKDISYFALDLEMALSMGKVGAYQMDMSSFKLGANLNW